MTTRSTATRINIKPRDGIITSTGIYRVQAATDDGFIISPQGVGGPTLHLTLTTQEVWDKIGDDVIRIERNWFDEGRARARLMAGVSGLSDVPKKEASEMVRQQYYLDEFLKREEKDRKNVKRTDKSIARTLKAIEIDRNVGTGRCDVEITTKRLPSPRTFRRWLKKYESDGYDILALRPRHRYKGNPDSPIKPEVERILQKYVLDYCDERRKSKKLLHAEMKAEIALLNVDREGRNLTPLSCPARATLSNRIDALNQFEVYASRHGFPKARAKFAIVGEGLDVARPLQHIQIDFWKLQLHTIAEQVGVGEQLSEDERQALAKERLYACAIIDIATRCILAICVAKTENAETAIEALSMAVSDKNAIAKAYECDSDWPMQGAFSLISPDGGRAFISDVFRASVAALKSVLENATTGVSHLRGHVERCFGTMNTSVLPNFTGRSFSNVVELGDYDAGRRAAVFSKNIPKILIRWVVDYYHHTPHTGLGGETPYCAWERLTARFGVDAPPNGHQRREIFGTELTRTLDQRGFCVAGVYYQSPEIQEFRRRVGDTKVNLKFDRSDIGHVSAWIGEKWLTVPSTRAMFRRVSLDTWLESVRDLRRRYARTAKVYEHIAHGAIRAISQTANDAIRQTSIGATRPTAAELAREEQQLLLGFEIVDDATLDNEVGLKPDLLSGAVEVASARPPITPTTVTRVGGNNDDYGLED